MGIQIKNHVVTTTYPTKTTPAWGNIVERWYQLDAAAFVLAESYWFLKDQFLNMPDLIILGSFGASNLTDYHFAQSVLSDAPSAQKFVHSLPNVRSSSLCQVMRWHGPLLCIQYDPRSFEAAVSEARRLIDTSGIKNVWCIGVTHSEIHGKHEVLWTEVTVDRGRSE